MQKNRQKLQTYHLPPSYQNHFSQKINEWRPKIIVSQLLRLRREKPEILVIVESIVTKNDDPRIQSYTQKHVPTLEEYYQIFFLIQKTSSETLADVNFKLSKFFIDELECLNSFLSYISLIHYPLNHIIESSVQKVLSAKYLQVIICHYDRLALCLRMIPVSLPVTDLNIEDTVVNNNTMNIILITIFKTKLLNILTKILQPHE